MCSTLRKRNRTLQTREKSGKKEVNNPQPPLQKKSLCGHTLVIKGMHESVSGNASEVGKWAEERQKGEIAPRRFSSSKRVKSLFGGGRRGRRGGEISVIKEP